MPLRSTDLNKEKVYINKALVSMLLQHHIYLQIYMYSYDYIQQPSLGLLSRVLMTCPLPQIQQHPPATRLQTCDQSISTTPAVGRIQHQKQLLLYKIIFQYRLYTLSRSKGFLKQRGAFKEYQKPLFFTQGLSEPYGWPWGRWGGSKLVVGGLGY